MHGKLLSQYCRDFDRTVRPLAGPLEQALLAVQNTPLDQAAAAAGPLADLRHHLGALLDKVAGQQAYVLIFGPLKSGKSTLMNALAAAYVSEVSCLPAYPCLVFVSHAERRRYHVARYDGTNEVFEDSATLAARIKEAHTQLADHLRKVEAEGVTFDPQADFPDAIRRIDVRVPAPNLGESGAVLVDTPGLYSRMRFGYSQMTRDFRDAAACAVFVVKSDNLFLEQVFAEFQDLLDLFSRIFLIVNVDSTKRDLRPDGTLGPSIEQTEPTQIVAAFEQLAMTAALKRAHEEGRLRIHPIDLMRAASARLRPTAAPPTDFADFERDLNEFLTSPDYLASFLRDSVRRATALVRDVARATETDAVASIDRYREQLERERRDAQARLAAAERLLGHPWERAFSGFDTRLKGELFNRAHEVGTKTVRLMEAGLDQWFMSGASLRSLTEQEWRPHLNTFRTQIETPAKDTLERSLLEREAGMDEARDLADDLRALGLDLAAIRRTVAAASLATPLPPIPPIKVDPDTVPLRRGVMDWALLRSLPRVRDLVFGPADAGDDHRIPAKLKASRMGPPARRMLFDLMQAAHETFCKAAEQQVSERAGLAVHRGTATELRSRVEARRRELENAVAEIDRRLQLCLQVLTPIRKLAEAASAATAALTTLATQHGVAEALSVNDDVVLTPVARAETGPRPRLRRR